MTEPQDPNAHLGLEPLADLEEGLLSPAEETAAREHLAGCAECQATSPRWPPSTRRCSPMPRSPCRDDIADRLLRRAGRASRHSAPAAAAATTLPVRLGPSRWERSRKPRARDPGGRRLHRPADASASSTCRGPSSRAPRRPRQRPRPPQRPAAAATPRCCTAATTTPPRPSAPTAQRSCRRRRPPPPHQPQRPAPQRQRRPPRRAAAAATTGGAARAAGSRRRPPSAAASAAAAARRQRPGPTPAPPRAAARPRARLPYRSSPPPRPMPWPSCATRRCAALRRPAAAVEHAAAGPRLRDLQRQASGDRRGR